MGRSNKIDLWRIFFLQYFFFFENSMQMAIETVIIIITLLNRIKAFLSIDQAIVLTFDDTKLTRNTLIILEIMAP